MKLLNEESNVEVSGIQESGTFSIKTTAAAFQLLSSGLYSNKIRAVIRELACNAHDAHVMNSNPEPIEIKLPNELDKQFYVKDFGPGLSHQQVMKLYTTYFDSTKQDSNDFIGGFGVGSKSPFAYTDSFTVESRQDGIVRTYSAYVDEQQVPQIVFMGESSTDEPSGLTVGFPVKPNDFRNFHAEALSVGQWFDTKPKLKGTVDEVESLDLNKLSDVVSFPGKTMHLNSAMVRLGNVAYPIKYNILNQEDEAQDELVRWLINRRIVLSMPIGSISVAASREELSYDKPTIKALKETLNNASKVCSSEIVQKVKEFDLSTREGRKEANNFLESFSLNRAELNEKTIKDAIDSGRTNNLPLLNRFFIEQGEDIQIIKDALLATQLRSTKNITIGRGRTGRIHEIDFNPHNPNGYNYQIDAAPTAEVVIIEKDMHKASPLAGRAWRNAYTKHAGQGTRRGYYSGNIIAVIEKPEDISDVDYEADKEKLLKSLGLKETVPLSEYLSEQDKKKLEKSNQKPSINARSMISNRIVSATEGQPIYWICADSGKEIDQIHNWISLNNTLINKDGDDIKELMRVLSIPTNAKLVVVSEDDVNKVSAFKGAKNLTKYVHEYLSSDAFKEYIASVPDAKGSKSGYVARAISYQKELVKALDNTILGDMFAKFEALPAHDLDEESITLYNGLYQLKRLDERMNNVYNIPTKIVEFMTIENYMEAEYPMLAAYFSKVTYASRVNTEHIKMYAAQCDALIKDKLAKTTVNTNPQDDLSM